MDTMKPQQQEPSKTDEAPFNMAMMYYWRINKLMDEKDKAAIMNDLYIWYKALRAIYRNIFFKVENGDKEDLERLFTSASKYLYEQVNNNSVGQQIKQMRFNEATKILDKIDCRIMVIMDKKKMIFPGIEAKGGLKELEKRFGISAENRDN